MTAMCLAAIIVTDRRSPWSWGPSPGCRIAIGAVVWALLNVGVAFWAIRALARRVLPGMQSPLARNLVLAVSVFPSAHCLYSSQTNLLVFSLVAFAAIAILDERWWLAALLLAIPVHIKVWPLAGALLLAACWPRRLAWRLPIALAAVAALPLLAKPPAWVCEQYVQWYRFLVGPTPDPSYLPRRLDDLGTDFLARRSAVVCRAATGDCGRGAGALPVASAPITPTTQGSFCTRLLDLMAACLWAGNRTEHVCLDCPPDELGLGRCRLGEAGRLVDGAQLSLTIFAAMGWVEDIIPGSKTLHPVGVLLFFAWFLWWNVGEPIWSAAFMPACTRSLRARTRSSHRDREESGDKSPHSKAAPSCFPADT